MPRYFQSTGTPAHDHELDELWRLYDALAARLGSASTDGATTATGSSTGATTGTETGTGTGTSGGTTGGGIGDSGTGVAMAPRRVADMTPAGTRQAVAGSWSQGGYVAAGDIVTIYSPGEFEGDLVVDGTVVIMPAPTGLTLGATMATMIGAALPMGPE